jgi:myosin heavy subunit
VSVGGVQLMELQEEMEKMQQEFQEAARRLTEDKDAEISRLQDDLEEMKQKGRTVEQYLLEKRELEARLSELEVNKPHPIPPFAAPGSMLRAHSSFREHCLAVMKVSLCGGELC